MEQMGVLTEVDMSKKNKLKNRNLYLDKLISFCDMEPVKVVIGIRRCGKSSLLKLMVEYLLEERGISKECIIEMNFESLEFKDTTEKDFYNYVKERCVTSMFF